MWAACEVPTSTPLAPLVFAFDALVLGLGIAANIGISFFAAFMLATLTVTGRHMMFRLTQEDDER